MAPSMKAAAPAKPNEQADNVAPPGFISLFNGPDFTGWNVPEGDGGHCKVING